jgi:6-phosphogluconolactonase
MLEDEVSAFWVFVGTYTPSVGAAGIYLCRFEEDAPALSVERSFASGENPSFLDLDPSGRFLYAVNELGYAEHGTPRGEVRSFSVDSRTGDIALLNRQSTLGADPCHLAVHAAVQRLFVANYRSGSVAVLPIGSDGSLLPAIQCLRHEPPESGGAAAAQPRAHSVSFSKDGRFAFVADLGLNRIMIYRVDPATGRVEPNEPRSMEMAPGSGPRHMALHPNGRWLYIINERASTIRACRIEAPTGALRTLQDIASLPEGFGGKNIGADIHLAPDGRFLYASNRGHDSIAIFAIAQDTGLLSRVAHVPCGGATPRNFMVSPSGAHVLVANQDSGTVVVFARDPHTGRLEQTGTKVDIPAPVCLKSFTDADTAARRIA